MKKVLVTGAKGQLGRCIADATSRFPTLTCTFIAKETLDINNTTAVHEFFTNNEFDYCINTAAYTNVEQAEEQTEQAMAVNAEAVKVLANACKKHHITLLHISTDYVFDGTQDRPYVETDATNPLNVYGASKLKGEQYLQKYCERFFIFRTSWLYSQYGHNFYKTILRHADAGTDLTITTEQTGTPTNANDLAKALLAVIASESTAYGLYHYSNSGEATWYDFAKAILEFSEQIAKTTLAQTAHYRTFAARPEYSVLDTTKFKNTFNNNPLPWKESLRELVATHTTNN
ncbi:MAG: dTDP-4-dehydrorhamnose reductase [Flavobacteriales bacterium]|jgi:dTDP-4-dehydrorhamnose reductase|nr:dTDP-4-dehydrorhamnose reductase [Flavobacteriales bacterium]